MTGQAEKHCVDCSGVLRTLGVMEQCESCGGSLVSEKELLSMYLQMRGNAHVDALPLVAVTAPGPARACPGCTTLMVCVHLEGVEIDYCQSHGFWFDPNEFQQVLESAGNDKPNQTKISFWRGLLDLFITVERRDAERRFRPKSEDPWFWLKEK